MQPNAHLAQRTIVLAACFLYLAVAGGSRFALGLTLKPMADELGWGRSALGAAMALSLLVAAGTTFIAGRMADRLSLHRVLAAGLMFSAIGIGAMSIVSTPWQAMLLYGVVFAIGNGVASPIPVGVLATRLFPGNAGLANAVVNSGMGVGQLLMIAGLAIVLAQSGWRLVFVWLGAANLVLIPLMLVAIGRAGAASSSGGTAASRGASIAEATRTRQFWLLASLYAVCGLQDFFVATHVAAFAQDKGASALLAGNLLALMGLAGLAGVLASGAWSDRSGPVAPTLFCFAVRVALFGWILLDQSQASVALFAILYGATYWITAPLTMVFVRDAFGVRNLGALSGLITMIHHMAGGLGAMIGAAWFDASGSYDAMFALLAGLSAMALALTAMLQHRAETRR
jgi:predicted MFS family arabinose efflux permease